VNGTYSAASKVHNRVCRGCHLIDVLPDGIAEKEKNDEEKKTKSPLAFKCARRSPIVSLSGEFGEMADLLQWKPIKARLENNYCRVVSLGTSNALLLHQRL